VPIHTAQQQPNQQQRNDGFEPTFHSLITDIVRRKKL
jgi:hypothetical protein